MPTRPIKTQIQTPNPVRTQAPVFVSIKALRHWKRNVRVHSKRQLSQIERSLLIGWTYSLIADEEGNVICGNGRLSAAQNLKLTKVPTIYLEGLNETEKRALALADNKIASNAGRDQQAPVPAGGAMFKRSWFRYYDSLPEQTWKTKVIMSWDTAAKAGTQNDYSVCTMRRGYLLDVVRGRFEYPQLRQMAISLAEKWKPYRILVEDASTGTALAQELRQAHFSTVKPVPVEHDKVGRAYVQQYKFEGGFVRFPKGMEFMTDVEAELLSFPQGRHDDIVDSIMQALAFKMTSYDETLSWVG